MIRCPYVGYDGGGRCTARLEGGGIQDQIHEKEGETREDAKCVVCLPCERCICYLNSLACLRDLPQDQSRRQGEYAVGFVRPPAS